jgi:hypothetical protein
MNLLQSHTAKSGKNAAWMTSFSSPNMRVLPPPQTPVGYEKGNQRPSNLYKMNNIGIHARYLSVNRTTPFLPLFCQKMGIFARKLPIFGPKNDPFHDRQNRESLSRRYLCFSRVSGQLVRELRVPSPELVAQAGG